jgi:hypothetical protein
MKTKKRPKYAAQPRKVHTRAMTMRQRILTILQDYSSLSPRNRALNHNVISLTTSAKRALRRVMGEGHACVHAHNRREVSQITCFTKPL